MLSDAVDVEFVPESGTVGLDSLESPVNLKMIIDDQKLQAEGFNDEDKDRIRIYSYADTAVTWVLEGGIRTDDTLSLPIRKLGVYALGIELSDISTDVTPPEIYEYGPQGGDATEAYPEIFGRIKDDRYGVGIDLSRSYIIINGDTMPTTFYPVDNKLAYQLSTADTIFGAHLDISIVASDFSGNHATKEFNLVLTGIQNNNHVPSVLRLYQNYPNPFNIETKIRFDLPVAGEIELNIFDIQGRYLRGLVRKALPAGTYTVPWDGTNNHGNTVSSGIYFYQLKTKKQTIIRKMQLLK